MDFGKSRLVLFGVLMLAFAMAAPAQEASPAAPSKPTPPAAKSSPRTASPQKSSTDDFKPDPKEIQLLKESYAIGAGLDAAARVPLLTEQCLAAEDMEELAKSWCTELFETAKDQLSAGNARAHAQTMAARGMSVRYPQNALSMLQDVDITDAQSDERAMVSRSVFEGVLRQQGIAAFPELLATAARLGETGAYPYFATTMLLYGDVKPRNFREASQQNYSETQVDRCNQVLLQGLTNFKNNTMNLPGDFQFMTLLRSASASGCPSGYLLHQAATDFAAELVKVGTAALNGDEKVRPQAAKNLYDSASRVLQEIEPVLAESVEKKIGDVRNLSAPPSIPEIKPASTSAWDDPQAKLLSDRIEADATILNNAPDGTTPHTEEMANAIRDGFVAMQKLIEKVQDLDPAAAQLLRRGRGNFPGFLDAAMRIWPDATIDQIEALPDGELKAHLLMTAARQIANNAEREMMQNRRPR